MKVIQKGRFAVWLSVLIIVVPVAATSGADGVPRSSEAILALVQEGRNREAIDAFEALPEDARDSLDLLRAVADSYWRERDFESAQALYSEILKRRPTLQGFVADDQPAGAEGVPIPATLRVPAAGSGDGTVDEKGVPPVADAEAAALAEGAETMLKQLRDQYLEIQNLARQHETQLKARLGTLQSDAETAMESLKAQHQAHAQALTAQVNSLEQTVETLRVALENERAALQAQIEQSARIAPPAGMGGEPVPRLMALAGYYRDQRDFAAACKVYEQVLEAHPDDVEAKQKLIMTLIEMRRYDDAAHYLEGGKLPEKQQEK